MEIQLIDPVMEELWAIQRELSRKRLSQTDEENRRDDEEVMKRAEAMLGRPLVAIPASSEIFNSRLPAETTDYSAST